MGWITERHWKTSGSINKTPQKNGSGNGPLRKVVQVLRNGTGMFDRDYVEFECGHTGHCTVGARRGRCKKCKELQEATASEKAIFT
jgi:hypothetical protein